MSRYHASSPSCSTAASELSHRQMYAPNLGAADKEWSIETTLDDYLFAAEMHAAYLLVTRQKRVPDKRSPNRISVRTRLTRQKRVPDKRSPNRISGRTRLLIKRGN